jgi:hypothetical protein
MSKYCQFCGNELKKTAKFCPHCGNKVQIEKKTSKATKAPTKSTSKSKQKTSPTPKTSEPATPPPVTPQPATPQPTQPIPPAQQHYQQQTTPQPTSAPIQQKKSNKGLIIGIVVAVVAILVVLIVVMMFFGGTIMGGDEAKFYGDWEYEVLGFSTSEFTFYKNNTYEFTSSSGFLVETGSWEVKDNKLVIESDMIGPGFMSANYDYEFSNNDNTVILTYLGFDMYTLTKK